MAISSAADEAIALQASKGIALITIGLPGSGKSSLARQFCDQGLDWRWVSTDNIRQQLFGAPEVQGPWPLVEAELLGKVAQAFQAGQNVVLDATHARRRQRRRAVMQLRDAGFKQLFGLWLDLPVGLCQMRNRRRERVVPADVIRRMQRYLCSTPPAASEGFTQLWRGRPGRDESLRWEILQPGPDCSATFELSTVALTQRVSHGIGL